jgi:hypothetical protein
MEVVGLEADDVHDLVGRLQAIEPGFVRALGREDAGGLLACGEDRGREEED